MKKDEAMCRGAIDVLHGGRAGGELVGPKRDDFDIQRTVHRDVFL
jgi:hypothetical protein